MGFYEHWNSTKRSKLLVVCLGIDFVASFVIGILIGRFATCPDVAEVRPAEVVLSGSSAVGLSTTTTSTSTTTTTDGGTSTSTTATESGPQIADLLMNSISSDNIRENLRMLTEKPHLAGEERNHELAMKIKDHWMSAGLDHVTLTPYHVMLSYPNPDDHNYVELLNETNGTVYKSALEEPFLRPEDNKTGVVPPFNAFSAPGDIYGDLVYVNYGRAEDYQYLEHNRSINISGKIAFARYGKIFRGDKVRQAEKRGAIGVILFSDPEDVTDDAKDRDINQVYPNDWWLPPSGAQRGTVFIGMGDPLTAGYPSIETAYRELDEENYLPKIPSHPIGYGIAIHLMRNLGGEDVPKAWQGGMNVTYKFGGGFQKQGWRAHIKVTTSNKNVTIYNAVGIIKGDIEPDRYVLIGNHRDAWVFGAIDPSGGTALIMEVSRVMGNLVKSGQWRPRRSIIFCSWGAEEYGLIGSTEWVEHYTKSLGARAVAYLNVDVAVQGTHSIKASGTPLLYRALYEATQRVPNPNITEIQAGRSTVYDTWMIASPWEEFHRPKILMPGSGSDYAPFRDRLGVPIVDFRFTWDTKLHPKLSQYPMYHSVYETFYLVDKIIDRGFKYHKAIGQIWAEMARNLADSLILPFNVSDYSKTVHNMVKTFMDRFSRQLTENGINTSLLDEAVNNFTHAAEDFERQIQSANINDPFVVRRINDQLMQIDRAFLDPAGLPGRRLKRHILFTESSVDNYAGSSFPGLSDALFEIEAGRNVSYHWQIVKRHYSVIMFTFQSAASTLKDVTDFMYDF